MVTRENAQDFASSQFQETSDAMGDFKDAAREAREEASSMFDTPFTPGAEAARGYGARLGRVADRLDGEDEVLALCARQAARSLGALSDELGRSSPRELYDKASDFARAEPALFTAGAALAGFALARFFKSRP